MNIPHKLLDFIKAMLPILKSAVEKSFDKLPKDAQDRLIQISKLVEVVKQMKGKLVPDVLTAIEKFAGISEADAEQWLIGYAQQVQTKQNVTAPEVIQYIWSQAEMRGVSAVGSFWKGLSDTLAELFSHVDWASLAYGIGQLVFEKFVKGQFATA